MKEAGIHFVARPNTAGHPTFTTVEGILSPRLPGKRCSWEGLHYKGEVGVYVTLGFGRRDVPESFWIIIDFPSREALFLYSKGMAIEDIKKSWGTFLGQHYFLSQLISEAQMAVLKRH